jgi:hypothetical protein
MSAHLLQNQDAVRNQITLSQISHEMESELKQKLLEVKG